MWPRYTIPRLHDFDFSVFTIGGALCVEDSLADMSEMKQFSYCASGLQPTVLPCSSSELMMNKIMEKAHLGENNVVLLKTKSHVFCSPVQVIENTSVETRQKGVPSTFADMLFWKNVYILKLATPSGETALQEQRRLRVCLMSCLQLLFPKNNVGFHFKSSQICSRVLLSM